MTVMHTCPDPDIPVPNESKKSPWDSARNHYVLSTSIVALITAGVNLVLIYAMSVWDLDLGLGLAAIGIITFIGTSMSSSIFEEHRHGHSEEHQDNKVIVGKNVPPSLKTFLKNYGVIDFENQLKTFLDKYVSATKKEEKDKIKDEIVKKFVDKKSKFIFIDNKNSKQDESGNFLSNVIVGTGIMRKSLAASLVITYIVLIGFSFSAGTLDDSLRAEVIAKSYNVTAFEELLEIQKGSPNADINISKIGMISSGGTNSTTSSGSTSSSSKSVEELLLAKEPSTLIGHFTLVISVVIGFYFGSNTLSALLKARKDDMTLHDEPSKEKISKMK